MRDPREAFLQSGAAAEFRKMVSSPAFDVACDYALLQMVYTALPNILPGKPVDPYGGLDANAQINGAKRVIHILRTLSDPIKEKLPPRRETLHYETTKHATDIDTNAKP